MGDRLVDLFNSAGLVESRGAARRAIAESGLSINNVWLNNPEEVLAPIHLLDGRWTVLRRGRRTLGVVLVEAEDPSISP